MDFNSFMQKFADEIDGQYSEYDNNRSVIVVKLPDERFQAVVGKKYKHEKYEREVIEFTSKVCHVNENIDYASILRETQSLIHGKFIIGEDDYLKVESVTYLDNCTEELLKEVIIEVANVADEYEFKITGKDVN